MAPEFVFDHFNLFFAFCVAWPLGWMGWGLWRRRKRGLFRGPPDAPIIYEEKTASGRSLKSWYTKLAGANNCLRLLVSSTELWITPIFAFSALGEILDLDHRIGLRQIIWVEHKSGIVTKSLRISYVGTDNEQRIVEITPRNMTRFVEALGQIGIRVNAI